VVKVGVGQGLDVPRGRVADVGDLANPTVALLKNHALKLQQCTNPDIKSYAKAHNLPYQRLRRLYRNQPTRSDRKPNNYRLSDTQDLALERYLDAIDAIGFGIHRGLVAQQAYAMLEEAYDGVDERPPPLGRNWSRRWLRSHPKYKRVKAKPIEVMRKLAQQPEALRLWFDKLKEWKNEHSIHDCDFYNMDETGCRIGVATNQYLYSKNGRTIFIPNANNRELVTLVECVSADGEAIPPMVIDKAATVMEHWVMDVPDGYLTAVSESGYSNDDLALSWLKHFNKMTIKRTRGAWRLLLVDGHASHATREFITYAQDSHIQVYSLPPHTTHLLQPLDVGCFQPLKWYHGRCLDWAARTGSKDISKADFMATLCELRGLTFTRNTIGSGWRRTGLAPYNPELVLAQLKRQEDCSDSERTATPPDTPTPQTPQPRSSPPPVSSSPSRAPPLKRFSLVKINLERAQLVRAAWPSDWTPEPENPAPGDAAWHTPKTVRQLHAQEPCVHAVLREHLPRDVAASVIKHQRGVAAMARTAEGLQRDLRRTEAAQIAKDERRRRKRRAIEARGEARGGPVYAETARSIVLQR
jgi:hypothetical protein